jgi:hypothetical protein
MCSAMFDYVSGRGDGFTWCADQELGYYRKIIFRAYGRSRFCTRVAGYRVVYIPQKPSASIKDESTKRVPCPVFAATTNIAACMRCAT